MKKRLLFITVIMTIIASMVFAGGTKKDEPPTPENPRIILATTTSTENSGLLGYLLPIFQEKTGYTVDVIAVGTGAAIAHGEKGDADVILVHARSKEDAFVASGFGINRRDVMHNDFIFLGPVSDPAGIKGAKSAAEALALIAGAGCDFVSRGDNSGTHTKELDLWKVAGITPAGAWYKEAGQGMGAVITMTNDMLGYTLADRGTYISMRDSIDLKVLFEGDPVMFNPYGIIAVNPEKHPHVNAEGAAALIDWIVSEEGQSLIAGYTMNGDQLFYPDAR